MEIAPGIKIVNTALWLPAHHTIIINDLHLGYEEALHHKGILVPKFQLQEIVKILNPILQKTKPETVVINGDLKHEFGTVSKQEWKEVMALLDHLLSKVKKIIIIRGNHDPIIKPIAEKRGIAVLPEYGLGNILIVHGDKLADTSAKYIIIGHEHPAIILREKSKYEKYKCFLKGMWKGKTLIAVPSFNPLLEGTDILKEQLLSPFLKNIHNYELFIVSEGEAFPFGKVKNLAKRKTNK